MARPAFIRRFAQILAIRIKSRRLRGAEDRSLKSFSSVRIAADDFGDAAGSTADPRDRVSMNSSDDTPTQATHRVATRIDVCPLCREPVAKGESTSVRARECGGCGFRLGVATHEEPDEPNVEPAAAAAQPAPAEVVLEKWLSGAPLEPERRTAWRRITRWARRNRPLAGAAAAAAAAIVLCIAHLHGSCRKLEESLRQTTFERDEALARSDRLETAAAEYARSVDEHVEESFRASERNLRVSIAREVAAEASDLATRRPDYGLAMATVALRMAHRENAPPIAPAVELVYGLSTRPVAARGEAIGRVEVLAMSPDGNRLAAAAPDGQVRLIDLVGGAAPVLLPGRLSRAVAIEFSPDGLRLTARSADSTVNIWRLDNGDVEKQLRTVLKVQESRMAGAVQSDDNRWIVAACNGFRPGETTVRLWDISGRNPNTNYFDLPGNRGRIQSVAVSRGGQWVAVGNHDGDIALWNTAIHPLRGITKLLKAGKHGVNPPVFTPDGRKLVTSEGTEGGDCVIRIWDLAAGDPAATVTLEGHVAPVRKLAVSTNSRCLASADDTGRVYVWNLDVPAGEARVASLEAHVDEVTALEFGYDGRRLYTAGLDGRVCVWDMTRLPITNPLVRLQAGESGVTGLVVSRDGRRLAAATADQNARFWQFDADDLLRWAHDGSRRQERPATTPIAETRTDDEPIRHAIPVMETAERLDLNPLR
jgi:WD40 repeat protein